MTLVMSEKCYIYFICCETNFDTVKIDRVLFIYRRLNLIDCDRCFSVPVIVLYAHDFVIVMHVNSVT